MCSKVNAHEFGVTEFICTSIFISACFQSWLVQYSHYDTIGGGAGGGVGGRGLLSRMAYTGRIRPKGDPFSGFRYAK